MGCMPVARQAEGNLWRRRPAWCRLVWTLLENCREGISRGSPSRADDFFSADACTIGRLPCWPVVALRLAVMLVDLVRIGGRWWLSCGKRSSR